MIVEFTAAAEADLEAFGDHIARALGFLRDLTRCCLELAEMPQAWSVVPRYEHHGIRRRVHGRYLIFHRIHAASPSCMSSTARWTWTPSCFRTGDDAARLQLM